jgi:phosphinothricin acetyltransferase
MPDLVIRRATPNDAGELLAIYRPIVEETAISFELECPTEADFAGRIERANETYSWLVAETGSRLAGYAYGSQFRPREAYRSSVEVSAYVHSDFRGRGIGSVLYERLFEELSDLGYFHAFGGITLPNPASVALHESVGFAHIGTFPNVGFKFGQLHDVGWWYRKIQDGAPG